MFLDDVVNGKERKFCLVKNEDRKVCLGEGR